MCGPDVSDLSLSLSLSSTSAPLITLVLLGKHGHLVHLVHLHVMIDMLKVFSNHSYYLALRLPLIPLVLPGKLGHLVNLVHQVHVMIGIFYSGQIYLQKHTGCSLKLFLRVCVCQPCVRRRSVKGVSVVVFIFLLQFFHILFSFQFSSSSVFFIFSSVFMFSVFSLHV